MKSSNAILDFFDTFNEKNGFEDEEDEFMKQEYLNMTVYSYFNFLDFLKEVAATDYDPLEEDWYVLRDSIKQLRSRLKNKYWDEIVYSNVEDMLFSVRHNSDCRFVESWLGTFYDFMNNDFPYLDYSYDEMIDYCYTLEFDGAMHEVNSSQVQAWRKRHNAGGNEDGIN